MYNLVWFRKDLRIHDNPALYEAINNRPCIAVFCLSDKQWDQHGLSAIQRQLTLEHLKSLKISLNKLNVPLIVLNTHSFSLISNILLELCNELKVKNVYFNHEYEANELDLTNNVIKVLSKNNIQTHSYHDQCIIAPKQVMNNQGECYKVFSAFKKKWLNSLTKQGRPLYSRPKIQNRVHIKTEKISFISTQLDDLENYTISIPEFDNRKLSEIHIHKYLTNFTVNKIDDYHLERDIPNLDSTSQLSTHLALGVITTRQCLQAVINSSPYSSNYSLNSLSEGAKSWVNELIWREFYRHILVSFPQVSKGKAFKKNTELFPWKSANASFHAWCRGLTGIPIIDAAMRQLNETGWMHNRLRMITAMYLTKHLQVDWRLGEQYFYNQLSDADLASNNGGWQWSASTGVDAVPYFRIFNPYRQAERFDPNGDFVRKYVKELCSIQGKAIHKPSEQIANMHNYPTPIVDLKAAAERTKETFKQLSSRHLNKGGE